MLEIKLLQIFAVCLGTVLVTGFCAVRSSGTARGSVLICFILTADTERVEYTVRSAVYPIAESFPEAELLVLDTGADEEALKIFGLLMERSCGYMMIT